MTDTIVFPGFSIKSLIDEENEAKDKKIVIGPGLKRQINDVRAIKCGILRSRTSNNLIVYWIDSHQKRYVAVRGERVIGVVVGKGAMSVNVDIGTSELASLSLLAFESATKRNRPNIQLGDLVYARILSANKDMKTELICVTSQMKKDGLGVLPQGGFMISVPLRVCRRLLSPGCKLIEILGSKFKYEITVGLNGRIWIRSPSITETIYIVNTFLSVEDKDEQGMLDLYKQITDKFQVIVR
uniref:Ribosomal RNA-processing protein 40 n=1 Tax=Tetranychus urticae TaxID=32264 RepID=T1K252_TETUR